MKRDMDMVRSILLEIRNCPNQHWVKTDPATISCSEDFHRKIMVQGGLLSVVNAGCPETECYTTTPEGLEFAELIASERVWGLAKRAIEHRLLGSAPYEIWKEACLKAARGGLLI